MPTPTPQYAATTGQTGSGDVVELSIDGGTTFLQVMATQKIAYSSQKTNFEDLTTTTSPTNPGSNIVVLENAPVSEDPGSFTFDVVFNAADPGQTALDAAYSSHTKLVVKHVFKALTGFTSGPINTFNCWVESFPQPGSDVAKNTVRSACAADYSAGAHWFCGRYGVDWRAGHPRHHDGNG